MIQSMDFSPATVIVLLLILAWVVWAVRRMFFRGMCDCHDGSDKKSASSGCAGCAGCSACNIQLPDDLPPANTAKQASGEQH